MAEGPRFASVPKSYREGSAGDGRFDVADGHGRVGDFQRRLPGLFGGLLCSDLDAPIG